MLLRHASIIYDDRETRYTVRCGTPRRSRHGRVDRTLFVCRDSWCRSRYWPRERHSACMGWAKGWADSRLESAGPGSRLERRSVRDLIVISCSGAGGGQVFARARHVDGRAASLPRSDARCACHVDGRLLRASSVSAPWRAPGSRGHTCTHNVRGWARFVLSVRWDHLRALREHVLVQEEKAGRIRGHPDVLDRPRHVDAVEFGARQRAERRVPEGDVPRYLAEM